MHTEFIDYQLDGLLMEGFLATEQKDTSEAKPLVLVVHDWTGNRELAQEKARYFAEQGFVGFAVDLYGKNKRGSDTDKSVNQKLLGELMQQRHMVVPRLQAALDCVKQHMQIDPQKIMLIGFCMGGLCVLDFARSGAKVAGVVSVHGLLHPPQNTAKNIVAKVLVLHGYEDKSVAPSQVLDFATEMTKHHADWQIHMFGNTYHAFTNPKANDLAAGLMFNSSANNRTWDLVRDFTTEIL